MQAMRSGRGPVILVSNAPRPSIDIPGQLARLGAGEDFYDAIVTSGDAAREYLASRPGANAFFVGAARDRGVFDGIGVNLTGEDKAALIACTGLFDDTIETPTLHRYAPRVAFQVFHEGQLVLRSANAPQTPMSSPRKSSRFATVNIDGNDWRVFATYGAERDVQVYVGEQMKSRMSILWAVLRSTMWPMALALPLLALAVWWSVFRGVSPLRRLGRALADAQRLCAQCRLGRLLG